MSSQAPTNRLILGAVLVLVGLAVGERSLAGERIECLRSRQTCVLERGSPLRAEPARAISIADVARVELRERETRGGARGETVLVSTRGAELRLAEADLEPARLHHARLAAFFRGEGEALEIVDRPAPWVAIGCFALAAFGLHQLVTGLLALRRAAAPAPVTAAPRTTAALPPWLRQAALVAGALVLLAIGLLGYASLTQGTLVLTCEQRCELADGGVCMPGETREFSLDAGSHAVKIFDPSAPGGWRTREVTLVAGETTALRCALP